MTKENHPVVFCLGQRYPGGDPPDWIKNEIGMNNLSGEQFLGALSASAEANKVQGMSIIDAINEGVHRDEWYGQLSNFIVQITSFNNLSLVISCRSNFVELIIDDTASDMLYRIEHLGFSGSGKRAAELYLSRQGIMLPGTPELAPEFSNPLFLKTCCRALKQQGLDSFPKGLEGLNGLFQFYIESVEKILHRVKGYRRRELGLHKLMNELAGEMFPDHIIGVSLDIENYTRLSNSDWMTLKKQIELHELRIVSLDVPTSWQALLEKDPSQAYPITRTVITAINNMLIDLMAAMSHKDWLSRRQRQKQGIERAHTLGKYRGKQADHERHQKVLYYRKVRKLSIRETADATGYSVSQICRIQALYRDKGFS